MRTDWSHIEPARTNVPGMPVTEEGFRFGLFILQHGNMQTRMMVDDGAETGWEHVSVSCLKSADKGRTSTGVTPSWETMQKVKEIFWSDEECVVQFHPKKSQYVNRHPNVLHLWRHVGVNIVTPPMELI